VIVRAFQDSVPLPSRRLWWDQVREAPEDRRMAVFSKGTPQGCIGLIPVGGHVIPISGVGESALWKKAQKNEKKNIISDMINKMKPIFSPWVTIEVCMPKKVASRIISRHQRVNINKVSNNPKAVVVNLSPWNQQTSPVVMIKALIAALIGHGLRSTMW